MIDDAGGDVDEDCDGVLVCYVDEDNDGFGDPTSEVTTLTEAEGCAASDSDGWDDDSTDCLDDAVTYPYDAPYTYPGSAPYDSTTACMTDYDEDDWGEKSPPTGVTSGSDCNDDLDTVNPGHTFDWVDGEDNQCDGVDDTFDLANADYLLYGAIITNPLTITRGGDVDGDGQVDLVLAEAAASRGPYPNAGAVYIFTTSVSSSPVSMSGADTILQGTDANFEVGASLAGSGRINKDGYADLLVGAPGEYVLVPGPTPPG